MRWLITSVLALVGLTSVPATCGERHILPGFDARAAGPILARPIKDFLCPPVPEPVTDMGAYQSRYDPSDPTQSRVDKRRVEAMAEREGRLKAFATQLSRLADMKVASNSDEPAVTRCVWSQLATWADAGALLANVERNDRVGRRVVTMMQAWQVTTYAAVALKLSDPREAEIRQARTRALAWIRGLIGSAMAEAAAAGPANRLSANHLYWVGVAAAFTSALSQDKEMEVFALQALRQGLKDVTPAGALGSEMRRGPRSQMYQIFGTLPLTMLARFAEANGHALSETERAALLRLVRFSGEALVDPATVGALAGTTQQVDPADRTALAWIDVILPSITRIDPATAARLSEIAEGRKQGPSWHIYAGGAVTAVYNAERLRTLLRH